MVEILPACLICYFPLTLYKRGIDMTAQYDIVNKKYVERNNNLMDTAIPVNELGQVLKRYSFDAWGRQKSVIDHSLFNGTWTFSVPQRVWEENTIDVSVQPPVLVPLSTLTKSTSVDGLLSVKSGTVANNGYVCRSKIHPRYQANRSQLYSTSIIVPNPTANALRTWGLTTNDDGISFELQGDGTNWELYATRIKGQTIVDQIPISQYLPAGFDPSKGHLYDIQFEWRGVGNIYFFVDLELVYTIELLGTLTGLATKDPALPLSFASITFDGVEVELLSGCADVSSEGGTNDRTLFRTVNTGSALVTLGAADTLTAILALRVPRTVTYNAQQVYNSRGAFADELITWTRDESRTTVFLARDINVPNINGITWSPIEDTLIEYVSGDNTGALNTAFALDQANCSEIMTEWANLDEKNIITNPTENSEFHLTPGDILIITVAAITTNKLSSASLYFSEQL